MEYTPETINISKLNEGFFLGDQMAGTNPYLLLQFKISHIINATGSQLFNQLSSMGMKYLTLNWSERPNQVIFDRNDEVVTKITSFIDKAMSNGDGLIVYSTKGQNRCCVVVLIYLMKKYKWTLKKSIEFLSSRKKDINIQKNFLMQLNLFEKRLYNKYGKNGVSNGWEESSCKSEEERIMRNTYVNGINKRIVESNNTKKHKGKKVGFADVIRTVGNLKNDLLFKQQIEPVTVHMTMKPLPSCIKNTGEVQSNYINYNNFANNPRTEDDNTLIENTNSVNNNSKSIGVGSSNTNCNNISLKKNNFVGDLTNDNVNSFGNAGTNTDNTLNKVINNNVNNIIPINMYGNDDISSNTNNSNKGNTSNTSNLNSLSNNNIQIINDNTNNFISDEINKEYYNKYLENKNKQSKNRYKNQHRPSSNYGQRCNINAENNSNTNLNGNVSSNTNLSGNQNNNTSLNSSNSINVTNNINQIVNNNINNFFIPQELLMNKMNNSTGFLLNKNHNLIGRQFNEINQINNLNNVNQNPNQNLNQNVVSVNTTNSSTGQKENKLFRSSSQNQKNKSNKEKIINKLSNSLNDSDLHFKKVNTIYNNGNLNEDKVNNTGDRSFNSLRENQLNIEKKYQDISNIFPNNNPYLHQQQILHHQSNNIHLHQAQNQMNNTFSNFSNLNMNINVGPFVNSTRPPVNNFIPNLVGGQGNQGTTFFNKPISHYPRSHGKNIKEFMLKKPSTPEPIKMVYFQGHNVFPNTGISISNNCNNMNINSLNRSSDYNGNYHFSPQKNININRFCSRKIISTNNRKRMYLLNKNLNDQSNNNISGSNNSNFKRPSTAPQKDKNNNNNNKSAVEYYNNNCSGMIPNYLKRIPSPDLQGKIIRHGNNNIMNRTQCLPKKKYRLGTPIVHPSNYINKINK